MVRSLFEHACVVWHPSTTQLVRLEKVQKKGIKWILNEQDHHYNNVEYIHRLRDLKILPIADRFIYSDLILFHKIFYCTSIIKMPNYIEPVTDDDINRLRNSHLDQLSLKCTILPHVTAFSQSYFFRCFAIWNRINISIRSLQNSDEFCSALLDYLWTTLLDNINQENDLLLADCWSDDDAVLEIGVT